jgi:4-hydroxyphenylacetate 3-monooxygenase
MYADEIFVGNFVPQTERTAKQSICCAMPVATPGLELWSRRPYGNAGSPGDYPLSTRFDETDAVLVCDRVKVPWERVFLHDNGPMSRRIFVDAPGITFANHQSNVRFWSKMGLVCGVAMRIAESAGLASVPSMKETLGDLASLEAMVGAMATGAAAAGDRHGEFVSPNARAVNACTYWCLEHHNEIIERLRTLLGGAPLQMPASDDALDDPGMREKFEKWFGGATVGASERMKLYKLAWDLVGSEFAGRHMLYERFYAGNPIVNRMSNFASAPWKDWSALAARVAGL